MIKVGDKVTVVLLGYAHDVSLVMARKEAEPFTVTEICSVSGLEGPHFYVEGGFYYTFEDIDKIYTKEKNPEYFL